MAQLFRLEELKNSPSRRHGVTEIQEKEYRRWASKFMDECGQQFKPPMY
jgi:hypothetical protein